MVNIPIMTTSGAVLIKAGTSLNNAVSGSTVCQFINEAEAEVNATTKYNWSDKYSTLNSDVKQILDMVVSNLSAIYCINYDMSSITSATSRLEAEDRITILRDAALRGLELLKSEDTKNFIEDA